MGRQLRSRLEHDLHAVLFDIWIPVPEIASTVSFLFQFEVWDFECNGLVRQCCKYDVLILSIRWLYPLFEGRHDPVPGSDVCFDFREIELKEQGPLLVLWVELFGHFVSWSSEFGAFFDRHFSYDGGCSFFSFQFQGGSFGKVLLVSFSLRMRQVVSFVGVQCEAQFAFVGA